jgi:drug/metabolite transporter (DMT)-like permease
MITGYLFAALTGLLFGFQGVYGRFLANKFPSVFLTWASFAFAVPLVITLLFVSSGYFFFSEKNIVKNIFATAMILFGAILILL